jgi:hypothetical protein
VKIPENMDAINSMILDDWRISAKTTAESIVISRERVGYTIYNILDMRMFSAKRAPKCLYADKCDWVLASQATLDRFRRMLWDFLTVS